MSTETLRVPHGETYQEKALRKFKQQPLVPLGALATTFTLLMAANKLRKRQSKDMNYWLRARVIAQGFTIAAVVAGAWMMGRTKPQIDQSAREQDEMLATLQKRREFEERLKNAEENHRREQEILNAPPSEGSSTPEVRDINAQSPQLPQTSSTWNPLRWYKGSNSK
ncbi:hypoxia induced protein conserved region-domain-containing protein [Thelephora terrestris]|uniref:Hypoxia induced protein conserved region-domain-containing protein n=1 Tax=Thelephora terrestris TaxID=56493 RepID=A0A9P6H844_9AGAM|nr:hypoxia induced protein conserved region-domain-containing protein [Thelephora terrestris]